MARLPDTFNIGEIGTITPEILLELLQRMYFDLANAINLKPDVIQRNVDGQTSDTFLDQATININLLTDKVEMLTNHVSSTAVTWTQLSP